MWQEKQNKKWNLKKKKKKNIIKKYLTFEKRKLTYKKFLSLTI